jgi:hypothetical protein
LNAIVQIYSHYQFLEVNGSAMQIHNLFSDFKKAYDSVMRKILYFILSEFGKNKERSKAIPVTGLGDL